MSCQCPGDKRRSSWGSQGLVVFLLWLIRPNSNGLRASLLSLGSKPCPEPGLALLNSLEARGSQQMEGAGWESASQSSGLLLLQRFQLENKSEGKAVSQTVGGFGLQVGGCFLGCQQQLKQLQSLTPWQCPLRRWQLSRGLAHKTLCFCGSHICSRNFCALCPP